MYKVLCSRCRSKIDSLDVRFLSTDKVVCSTCFSSFNKQGSRLKLDMTPKHKEKYFCNSCGQTTEFTVASSVRRHCMFCGSEDIAKKEPLAAKLIGESIK